MIRIKKLSEKFDMVFEKVGTFTKRQCILIYVLTFAFIGSGYYYFIFVPDNEKLRKIKNQYQKQLNTFSTYKKRADQITKYENIMAQTIEEFNTAMEALPDKRELPSLLTGISNAGSDAGLELHLFKPENEIDKEFYKKIPVSIKLTGRYHQITDFFYQIIKLNRIVNINDVDLKSKKGSNELGMTCKAITYMFVEKSHHKIKTFDQSSQQKSKEKPINQSVKRVSEHYDSLGKIDPFKPLIQEKPLEITPVFDKKPKRILTPLEKIGLSQVRLVAVIIMKNRQIAMVEEASGKGYEVRLGTYIGKNHGKVFKIKQNSILVKEFVKNYKGRVEEHVREIKFHKMDEAG